MSPADVGLGVFQRLFFFVAFPHLELVEPRFEHRHCFGAIAVLRAVILALHHDACRRVGNAYGGIGFIDVLAAGARRAESIDAQVGRVDLDRYGLVDFRIDEHARK